VKEGSVAVAVILWALADGIGAREDVLAAIGYAAKVISFKNVFD